MKLLINHTTRYSFGAPVTYGLQQLRKTPKSFRAQKVLDWSTALEGATLQASFADYHRNQVDLVSLEPDTQQVVIRSRGTVEMTDTAGVVGPHEGFTPLWLFERTTELTKPGPHARALVRQVEGDDPLERLHSLTSVIAGAVRYEVGQSTPDTTAEDAIEAGRGVCQDHTHVFVTCARLMGFPARYVSGYLMMNDRTEQDAMHAWAEAHVDGLGWVGFDVSNGISPDARYVRVATGLDYLQAAPVTGLMFGGADESLSVELEVVQQQEQ